MKKKYKVITLCGSTRFKDAFNEAQKRLTLEGHIVISVGLFGHSGDEEVWKPGIKDMLDRMHMSKIDMADEIFVINVNGYIGESTKEEIVYALSRGKVVKYLEEPNFTILNQENIKEETIFWPSIEDYIDALGNPLDAFHKLKRFKPLILPDGSFDYWNDNQRLVFHMIDSMDENFEFGLECCLTKQYCDNFQKNYKANDDLKIYSDEITIGSLTFPAIIHKKYEISESAETKYKYEKKYSRHILSEDKKTFLQCVVPTVLLRKRKLQVIIPEGVENIADGAFSGCEYLSTVVFPTTLKRIGNWAFADCKDIEIINKAEIIEDIGEYAFYGCFVMLDSPMSGFPNFIKKVHEKSFSKLRFLKSNKQFEISLIKKENLWEAQLQEYNYISPYNDNIDLEKLETIVDDDGVIYDKSFRYVIGCNNKNLVTYKIKSGAKVIISGAFKELLNLKEIDLSTIESIGNDAFSYCKNLESIKFGNTINKIGCKSFCNTAIKNLYLPSSVTQLGADAFSCCTYLESVILDCPLEELEDGIFEQCQSLHTVRLSNTIKVIGRMTFGKCKSLSSITLPSELRKLGELCFVNDPIKEIILPKTLVAMDYSPFCGCTNIKIKSESDFFYANDQFLFGFRKTKLISYLLDEVNIVVPSTVNTLLGYSLCNKRKTKKIYLPNSVKCLGHWCFRFASAESINIPDSVIFKQSSFDYQCGIKQYIYRSQKNNS